MSQSEILELLEKEKFPLSLGEICEKLGDDSNNAKYKINKVLSKLIQHKEIRFIELDRTLSMKFLGCKRGIRLYYC